MEKTSRQVKLRLWSLYNEALVREKKIWEALIYKLRQIEVVGVKGIAKEKA